MIDSSVSQYTVCIEQEYFVHLLRMLSFGFFFSFNQVGKTSPHINIISFSVIFSLVSGGNLFSSSTEICL